jgi:hypothetical protein
VWLGIGILPVVGTILLFIGVIIGSASVAYAGLPLLALFFLRWAGVLNVTLVPLLRWAARRRDG